MPNALLPRVFLALSLVVVGGCASDPYEADDADAGSVGLQCCAMQAICRHCVCTEAQNTIAESNQESACEQFLDSDAWSCVPSRITGQPYGESEAVAECL